MKRRFRDFLLDSGTRQLLRGRQAIHLSPKAFELLRLLAQHHEKAFSKAELHQHLWPNTFVSDGSLTIPRAMIEAFPETMAWEGCVLVDCPPSRIARISTDRVELPGGHVTISASSEIVFGIDHPEAP